MSLGFLPLNQTVIVRRSELDEWGTVNPNGQDTFYRVRVDYDIEEKKIAASRGDELVYTGAVIFLGNVPIVREGESLPPDILEVDGREYKAKKIEYLRDLGGTIIHTRVLF
ncbi:MULTISPECIES: hypothetical protein [unclassified Exiguobacterium]|uniref:hypothetical protein n=1 Tax=unclassified Exiguobacterium TaxID=2644629 RepID=UPI001BE6AA61|nr:MULTISPECIES: hypothetical protein [unclassified Exiguobacterium]